MSDKYQIQAAIYLEREQFVKLVKDSFGIDDFNISLDMQLGSDNHVAIPVELYTELDQSEFKEWLDGSWYGDEPPNTYAAYMTPSIVKELRLRGVLPDVLTVVSTSY